MIGWGESNFITFKAIDSFYIDYEYFDIPFHYDVLELIDGVVVPGELYKVNLN